VNRLWTPIPNILSPIECDLLKEEYTDLCLQDGLITVNGNLAANKNIRRSKVAWLEKTPGANAIRTRLDEVVRIENARNFNFDVEGFDNGIQIARYSLNDHYAWHIDNGAGQLSRRKLTLVVQLSDSEAYEDGNFELMCKSDPVCCPREKGSGILFPSFLLHRAMHVSKGERFSLTAWMMGPAFR